MVVFVSVLLLLLVLGVHAQTPSRTSIKIGVQLPLTTQVVRDRNVSITALQAINLALGTLGASNQNLNAVEISKGMTAAGVGFSLEVIDTVQPFPTQFGGRTLNPIPGPVTLENMTASALSATVELLSRGVAAVIGDFGSEATQAQAFLTSRFAVPQCSYIAGSAALSNRAKYPYFFRTISPVTKLAAGLIRLCQAQGWKSIAVLYPTDDAFSSSFIPALNASDLRITNFPMPPHREEQAVREAVAASRVVFAPAFGDGLIATLKAIERTNNFASTAWVFVNDIRPKVKANMSSSFLESNPSSPLVGSTMITLPNDTKNILQFGKFIDLWTGYFNITPRPDGFEYNEISAFACATVLLRTIVRAIDSAPDPRAAALALAAGTWPKPVRVPDDLNAVKATGALGLISFDENGDADIGYEVYNWQPGKVTLMSQFLGGSPLERPVTRTFYFPDGKPTWKDSVSLREISVTIRQPLGQLLAILATIGILMTLFFTVVIVRGRHTPTIRAVSPRFCMLVLLGLALLYTSVGFQLAADPLLDQRTSSILCNVTPISFVIGLSLVISNIISKNHRLWQIFGSPLLFRQGVSDQYVFRRAALIVVANAALCVWWLLTAPFERLNINSDRETYCMCWMAPVGKEAGAVIDASDVPDLYNSIPFMLICVLDGILMVYAVILAWNTRKIPIRGFAPLTITALAQQNIFLGSMIVMPTFFAPLNSLYLVTMMLRTMVVLFCATFALFVFFVPPVYILWVYRDRPEAAIELDRIPTHGKHSAPGSTGAAGVGGPGAGGVSASGLARLSSAWDVFDTSAAAASGSPNALSPAAATDAYSAYPMASRLADPSLPTGTSSPQMRRRRSVAHFGTSGAHSLAFAPRLTQGPGIASDSFDGTLLVSKTSRMLPAFMDRMLGHYLPTWTRWRLAHVMLVPDRRLVTISEVIGASPAPSAAARGPTASNIAHHDDRVHWAFEYVSVTGPNDRLLLHQREQNAKAAASILPSAGLYDLRGGASSSFPPPHEQQHQHDGAADINPCRIVVRSTRHEFVFESQTPDEAAHWVALFQLGLSPHSTSGSASGGGGGGGGAGVGGGGGGWEPQSAVSATAYAYAYDEGDPEGGRPATTID
ncbi:hypothetical protein BC828DRAFT_429893 [Blastocladiella britannica]|nr:hypothetical protein BC828DRAFT_429893 [Blastocladiella britannica]